jgi:bla regulator protein blaR1
MNLIDLAGLTLLHFVWQGTLIGAATAVLLQLLRRRSPQARYRAACVALVLMLAAPVVTSFTLGRSTPVYAASPVAARSLGAAAPAGSYDSHADAAVAPAARVNESNIPWLTIVVAVWMAGVAVLLTRVAGAWWSVRRLQRAAFVSAPSRFIAHAQRLSSRLGLDRALHVVDSIDVDTPTVIGWLKPAVLLPVAAMANLTPAQVEAVLAHELAHVRRHDSLVNLLQIAAETMLFYHPAVWWVSAHIRTEREHGCDEIARRCAAMRSRTLKRSSSSNDGALTPRRSR